MDTIKFLYPVSIDQSSSIDEAELRSPELGNTRSNDLGLVINESMDGGLYTYVKTPVLKAQSLSFTDIKEVDFNAFILFFITYAGLVIGYLDYNDNLWQGRIINNPLEGVTVGVCKTDFEERWAFTVEFEGSRVEVTT